jgi:hypothetical protein
LSWASRLPLLNQNADASKTRPVTSPVFFLDAGAFRAWLEQHAASASERIVCYHKVGTGLPSMTRSESVDEALCVGRIDGVRKRIDDHSYQIRFRPRRPGSIWSAINITKVEALSAQVSVGEERLCVGHALAPPAATTDSPRPKPASRRSTRHQPLLALAALSRAPSSESCA